MSCLLIPVFLVSTFESSSEENLSTILCGYVFQFPRAYSSAVCIKVSWMLIRFKSTGARLTSPPSTARNGPHWTLQVFLFWTIRITIRKVKTRPCLRVSDTRTILKERVKEKGRKFPHQFLIPVSSLLEEPTEPSLYLLFACGWIEDAATISPTLVSPILSVFLSFSPPLSFYSSFYL